MHVIGTINICEPIYVGSSQINGKNRNYYLNKNEFKIKTNKIIYIYLQLVTKLTKTNYPNLI